MSDVLETLRSAVKEFRDHMKLAALVGEMDAQPCEHSQHGTNSRHNDAPASHYVRGFCACSGWTDAYAACPAFVAFALSGRLNRCPDCQRFAFTTEMFEVLGPVGSASK